MRGLCGYGQERSVRVLGCMGFWAFWCTGADVRSDTVACVTKDPAFQIADAPSALVPNPRCHGHLGARLLGRLSGARAASSRVARSGRTGSVGPLGSIKAGTHGPKIPKKSHNSTPTPQTYARSPTPGISRFSAHRFSFRKSELEGPNLPGKRRIKHPRVL
jgi:hypothetical protein